LLTLAGGLTVLVGTGLPWLHTLLRWRGGALDPRLALVLSLALVLAALASFRWAWARVAAIGAGATALSFMLLTYVNAPLSPGSGKALALAGTIAASAGAVVGWHDVWTSVAGRTGGETRAAR
jgi:hypothetical protein